MYENYVEIIKDRLNPKRFTHSMNVAKKAAELAEKFGGDRDKAYLCGLLHDICKNETSENMLQIINRFGIILDNVQASEPKLWHSIAGAAYIENVLGIDDREIIDAVRYHTTARADMTLMDKILFLADFISDERDFDGVDKLRSAVKKGLDNAIFESLRFSIDDLCKRKKTIHIDTVNAYNQFAAAYND